ncbi:hypothetical protein DITRI_Ditri20bG0013000 [Diplodiscus trichospermus]
MHATYREFSTISVENWSCSSRGYDNKGNPCILCTQLIGNFPQFLSRIGPAPAGDMITKETPVAVGDGTKPSCGCLGRDTTANAAAKVAPAVVTLFLPLSIIPV